LADIFDGLSQIGDDLSPGPDAVPAIFWKNCCYSVAYPIFVLFNWSLNSGIFPNAWKTSFVTPI